MTFRLSAIAGALCLLAAGSAAAAPYCSIYDGVGFSGAEKQIGENVEYANLAKRGFSQSASSAKADERCRLLLYPEPDFVGAGFKMPKGVRIADLSTVNFDDKAQSLQCICDGSR